MGDQVLVVEHGFEGLRRCAYAASFDPARAVFCSGGSGVAHHAAGSDVAGEPGEGCGGVLGAEQFGLFDVARCS